MLKKSKFAPHFNAELNRIISRKVRIISLIFKLSTGYAKTPIFTGLTGVFHKNGTEQFIAGRPFKAPSRAEFEDRKNIKYI